MRRSLSVVLMLVAVAGSAFAAEQDRGKGQNRQQAVDLWDTGAPLLVERPGMQGRESVREASRSAARVLATRFGGDGSESFELKNVIEDDLGQVHYRMNQSWAGLPVIGGELILHADRESGVLLGVNGRFVPGKGLSRSPKVGPQIAISGAVDAAGIADWRQLSHPELVVLVLPGGEAALSWAATITYESDQGIEIDRIYADAMEGGLLDRHPQVHRAKYRKTYTANNGTSLPGTLLFNEGGSSSDTTAMNAYNNAGTTYDYYKNRHNRDSYDNAGATISQTVHYSSQYNNAYWNGVQMVYGDGDGVTFSPLGNALDVVAHELTHAVTERAAGLVYANESGALNESMSDVFGAATEAYKSGVSTNTWKIGEAVYTPSTSGDALRYMNNPTQDGSSRDYYQLRYVGSSDNGGVHWNSGISNLAFYLLSQGGTHPRGKTTTSVGALGITKAEKIFYRALEVYFVSSTNFRNARLLSIQAAKDLYGSTSNESTQTGKAWDAVGNAWTTYSGTISTSGSSQSSASYVTSVTGYHTGQLFGPSGKDYDLYLQKWNGSSWANVASGTTSSANETVQYSGTSGTYRWTVTAYSGTGSYTLYGNRP